MTTTQATTNADLKRQRLGRRLRRGVYFAIVGLVAEESFRVAYGQATLRDVAGMAIGFGVVIAGFILARSLEAPKA